MADDKGTTEKRCALCTGPIHGDGANCAYCGATKPPTYSDVNFKDRRGS